MNTEGIYIQNFLNCYCREHALPNKHILDPHTEGPLSLPNEFVENKREQVSRLLIVMPNTKIHLVFKVAEFVSCLGTYEYLGLAYFLGNTQEWRKLTALKLSTLIQDEMNQTYQVSNNPDLAVQIADSVRVTDAILKKIDSENTSLNASQDGEESFRNFLISEQNLVFGHPFHPHPKSRIGFNTDDLLKYSPEFNPELRLHYFGVHKDYVVSKNLDSNDNPFGFEEPIHENDYVSIPVHPWEARTLLAHSDLKAAIASGHVRNFGVQGKVFYPTSSVRTVLNPDLPYQFKLSLHVRITNCIRRNAPSDLRNGFEITRLLRLFQKEAEQKFPAFTPIEESAYVHTQLPLNSETESERLNESFSVILRKNFLNTLKPGITPILAAYLFGNGAIGRKALTEYAGDSADVWFENYLDVLLEPLFFYFFEKGIMFEPHLQNTLIGIKDKSPRHIFVRDLDNVRIVRGSLCERKIEESTHEPLQAIYYSYDQAWARFFYCLLVNNLGEAIYQISRGSTIFENKLWKLLKERLLHIGNNYGSKTKQDIDKLVHGNSLPAKANLITRFQRTPDFKAIYVGIPNPMAE